MRYCVTDSDVEKINFCVLATPDYKQFTLFAEDMYYPPTYLVVFGPAPLNNCEKEIEDLRHHNPFIHPRHAIN
jgi:hypothetical protein